MNVDTYNRAGRQRSLNSVEGDQIYQKAVVDFWPAHAVCDQPLRNAPSDIGPGLIRLCGCKDVRWHMRMDGKGGWEIIK